MYSFQIKGKIKIMGLFTGNFYSKNLRMTTQINVIFPDVSNDVTPLYEGTPKVLYLLHGLSGNSDEWTRFSKIEYYAKKYNFIIIMPEVQRSFYTTGKVGIDYFHYVADELPAICGKWFHLDQRRENTFIAGESMGGYGAVKIALNRPEKYEAVASLSGVLDYVGFNGDGTCRKLGRYVATRNTEFSWRSRKTRRVGKSTVFGRETC